MSYPIRSILALVVTGLMVLSCGEMRTPLESADTRPAESIVTVPNASGDHFIVFGDAALVAAKRALKEGSLYVQEDDKRIKTRATWDDDEQEERDDVDNDDEDYEEEGDDEDEKEGNRDNKKAKLKVKFKRYDSPVQVKKAEFKIPKNAIGGVAPERGRYHIKMRVTSGTSLADIRVMFQPSGMTFDPDATLKIRIKGNVDGRNLTAYHVHKNGRVTKPVMRAKKERDGWKLDVKVKSFSEYSWDDQMDQEANEQANYYGW